MKKIVVIVDMQYDFVDGTLGTTEAQNVLNRIVEQYNLDEPDTFYIFTQDTHYDNYMTTLEGKYLPVPHCIAGTMGWEIYEDLLDRIVNPTIIEKNNFASDDVVLQIQELLDEFGYDAEIEFRGVCTDICVISNAILAKTWFPETVIKVNSALCAGTTPEKHKAALAVMESCQIEVM